MLPGSFYLHQLELAKTIFDGIEFNDGVDVHYNLSAFSENLLDELPSILYLYCTIGFLSITVSIRMT
ncbi:hypothetical protein ACJVDH_08175 [Pedobacter sp. AW1-32]|uniref:hypothetical protein n=1 Tax=Pedobacter sp. AW1-32 TaxID=3383026 RepID=UPI003FED7B5C